jgi:SulP family sulfate permease
VLLGVAISIVLYIVHQANRVRLVELIPVDGGFPVERPTPRQLSSHKVTAMFPYGSLFYAAARTLEENLPAAEEARLAVVIVLLRGCDQSGSKMIAVLDR